MKYTIVKVAGYIDKETLEVTLACSTKDAKIYWAYGRDASVNQYSFEYERAIPVDAKNNEISAVEYGMIQTQLTGFRGYMMTENDYVINGNNLIFDSHITCRLYDKKLVTD